jgi:hypothetical protein
LRARSVVVEEEVADVGNDVKPGGTGTRGILGQAGALAAEGSSYPVAVGRAAEHIRATMRLFFPMKGNNFGKVRDRRKFGERRVEQRQPVLPDAIRCVHQNLVERSTGRSREMARSTG